MKKIREAVAITLVVALATGGMTEILLHQPKRLSTEPNTGNFISPPSPHLIYLIQKTGDLDKAAATALDAGKYKEAETDAQRSVTLFYGSGLGQKLLAATLYAQNKTQASLKVYKAIADARSDDPTDLLPYSLLLSKTGQWADAVTIFNMALPRVGDPVEGGRAALQRTYGSFSPTSRQPHELETAAHLALGMHYESSGSWGGHRQTKQAMAEYHKAYVLSPDSALTQRFEKHRLAMQETQQRLSQRSGGYKAKPSGQ